MSTSSSSASSAPSASSSSSSMTSVPQEKPRAQPFPQRTMSSVREQVAEEIAMRAVTKSQRLDDVQIGVTLTFSSKKSTERDLSFLSNIASFIDRLSHPRQYLFILATTGKPPPDSLANFVLICASDDDYIQRAAMLVLAKFVDRVIGIRPGSLERLWIGEIKDVGLSSYDELSLWDVVKKSARAPIDPLLPHQGSKSAERMLSDVRAQLQRLSPLEAYRELQDPTNGTDGVFAPTFLVDIRSQAEREAEGGVAGALIVERGQLEWKFDPRSDDRLSIVDRYDLRIIVILRGWQGEQPGSRATERVGAWKEGGFPVFVVEAERISRSLMVDLDTALEVINEHVNGKHL
ncbi:hypothetical protein VNI00_007163 [Paramarasmius palmivorus]|uniref:CD-NTase-associated protein 12/Pycsar effector protein TIR domain-containing protein n=1 Tax=Paramarasmius palmivorus TaxID=297713 RepID=A0AAW0D3V2_9AGAR